LPLLVLALPLALACYRAASALEDKKSSGKLLGEERDDACCFQIEDVHDELPTTFVHDNPLLPRPGLRTADITIRVEVCDDIPELDTHEARRQEDRNPGPARLSLHEPCDRSKGSLALAPPGEVALEVIVASNALQPVVQSEEEISATVADSLELSSPPSSLSVHKETDQEPQEGHEEPRKIVLRHVHRPSLSKIARAHAAFKDGLVIVPRDSVPRV